VNCIILGRAEAYANKHTPGLSVMDAIGMGLGFTIALTLAGLLREVLGKGTAFGLQIFPESWEPIGIFVQPPGAFLVIAFFIIIMNAIGIKTRQRKLVESGCDGNCSLCASAASCETKPEKAGTVEKKEPAAEAKTAKGGEQP
jgi:electron transport complex protein RnfE